jgi:hypothetical protein
MIEDDLDEESWYAKTKRVTGVWQIKTYSFVIFASFSNKKLSA